MAALIVVLLVAKVLQLWVVDTIHAAKGTTPPRWQYRIDRAQAAGKKSPTRPRYGSADYFRDLWHDVVEDARARRVAKRDQRPEDWAQQPGPVVRAGAKTAQVLAGNRAKAAPKPVPVATDPPRANGPITACEYCGERLEPPTYEHSDGATTCPMTGRTYPEQRSQPEQQPSNGGTPMVQPTGDATNFETAGAELDAVLTALGRLGDHTTSLRASLNKADDVADAYDGDRTQLAAAIDQLGAALAKKRVAPGIVANAQAVLDAVSPTEIRQLIDAIAAADSIRAKIITSLDTATAAAIAAKAEIDARYAEAKDLVGDTDGTFLNT